VFFSTTDEPRFRAERTAAKSACRCVSVSGEFTRRFYHPARTKADAVPHMEHIANPQSSR
jgi:hypothetical protein